MSCTEKKNSKLEETAFNNQDSITALDWLRLTTNDLKNYRETISSLTTSIEPGVTTQDEKCTGILEEAGMKVHWTEKGLHGYETSASIKIWKDNDYLTVDNIVYSEGGRNKGGLFELSGVGCKGATARIPCTVVRTLQRPIALPNGASDETIHADGGRIASPSPVLCPMP